MDQIQGYILSCKWCDSMFAICKHCYRGHRYCSENCRHRGYEQARKAARHRHEASEEARLDHRDRQKRYRKTRFEKTVTDKGSNFSELSLVSSLCSHLDPDQLAKIGACIACGRRVWPNLGV